MLCKRNNADVYALTEAELDTFKQAWESVDEANPLQILQQLYPYVLTFRDDIYKEAATESSKSESSRITAIAKVVNYAFNTIDPNDQYTAETDIKHFKDVSYLSANRWENLYPSKQMPITLTVASWFHDIERFIPQTKQKTLQPIVVDELRKTLMHPVMSSKVANVLLQGSPLTTDELNTILQLIIHHEKPLGERIAVNNHLYLDASESKYDNELSVLIDSDALAFFETTINYFITHKAKKQKPEWIWKRIMKNLERLDSSLQPDAVKKIQNLPQECKEKLPDNWEVELTAYLQKTQFPKPIPTGTEPFEASVPVVQKPCSMCGEEIFLRDLFAKLNEPSTQGAASDDGEKYERVRKGKHSQNQVAMLLPMVTLMIGIVMFVLVFIKAVLYKYQAKSANIVSDVPEKWIV